MGWLITQTSSNPKVLFQIDSPYERMAPPLARSAPGELNHWWSQLRFRLQNRKGWNEMLDETFLLQNKRTNDVPLFFAAKENSAGCIKKLLDCASTNIFERGALGETVLHVAVMNDNMEAAVALMDGAPELINEPMTSDLFLGMTPLHVAVVNQSVNLVRSLIGRGADVATPRVTGLYFRKRRGGLLYHGEHILTFAACVGNQDIISMVINAGASTRAQDSIGNTVLHILVLQPNKTIACMALDLLLAHDVELDQAVPLDMVPNYRGLTPFKLAAKEGNLVAFQHLVNRRRVVQWNLGPLTSNLYDLTEIDSLVADDDLSVLELIVGSQRREARRILEVTPVRQLVSLKWNLYGKHYFRLLLLLYVLYIGIFTLCCVCRPLKDAPENYTVSDMDKTIRVQKSLKESYVTYGDNLRLGGEMISVLGALVILLLEIPDMLRVGAKQYFGQTALGGPFHVILIAYAMLVVLLCVFRVSGVQGEAVVMAVCLLFQIDSPYERMAPPLARSAPGELNHWWSQLRFRLQNRKGWNEMLDETFLLQNKRAGCIKKLLDCASTNIFERGALGETALHVAVLNDNMEAAVALMDGAPELINEPMTSDLFLGMTPLHVAVVNQNVNLVRSLIGRGADVATPRVTGLYFRKRRGGLLYYGEHILAFAACVGNQDIISMVINAGASTRAQDSNGNTVLHILVLQPNKTIACLALDLLLAHDVELDQAVPLDMVPNYRGLTPFKLAAKEGNLVAFQHLVNRRRVVQWTLGPLTSNLYDLTEIDSLVADDDLSVLELIVGSQKREARRILEVTPVRQLVSLKWNLYGKHYFRLLLLLYVLYIGTFTLCCVCRPLKDAPENYTVSDMDKTIRVQKTLKESYVTYGDNLRLAGEMISVLGALVILLLEIPDMLRVGAKQYFGQTALGGPFHVILIAYAILVVLLCVFRVSGVQGEAVVMAVCLVLGWSNVMFFARGFQMLGPYIIFGDLTKFMWLSFIMLIGFSTSLWMVYMTQDPDSLPAYRSFPITLFSQFELSVGLIDLPVDHTITTPPIVHVLHCTFSVVVATTLMLERRLPRCLWPRLGVCGLLYGLGERWYLRVEDRNDPLVQKMRRYIQAFSKDEDQSKEHEEMENTDMSKGPVTPLNRPKHSGGIDGNRKSLACWQMIRHSTLGLDVEQEELDDDQEPFEIDSPYERMAPPLARSAPGELSHWWSQLRFRLQNRKGWKEMLDETFLLQNKRTNNVPLFFAAKENSAGCIKKLLDCASTNIFERGALGETALHVAVMNDNMEAALALMDGAPELINEPMTSDLFLGMTPLHVAVVNQNINLVRSLIGRGADVATPRVTGLYFRKRRGGLLYYGEHILAFAACVGNQDIISMVINAGASTRAQDSIGNTVLHILVLQPNKTIACMAMDLVLARDVELDQAVPLDMVPNYRGLTPFKLAAKEGNLVAFQHLVNRRRVVQWNLGPLSSNLYDLTEIDSWANNLSVLELIVGSQRREARRILEVTPVRQLVSLKWNLYGKHYFRLLLLLYVLYIGIFTLCCVCRPLKDAPENYTVSDRDKTIRVQKTLKESYVTYGDNLRLGGEMISVLGALVILLLEIPDMLRVGAKHYFGQTALGGPFHVILIAYAMLVVLLCVFRVSGVQGEAVVMAFMWLSFIMLIGFSTSLWMVYMTQDPDSLPAYHSFPITLFSLFELSVGLIDLPVDNTIITPPIVHVLHCTFSVVVATTLMLERRLPRCLWPRLGVCGLLYGLGERWYLRVEDRKDPLVQKMRRYIQAFSKDEDQSKERKEEEKGPGNRKSLEFWQMIRHSALGLDMEQEEPEDDLEVR
ncbi:unnamed protein product [Coregonus sp. 'balchen']|nr:unnamed protein product [Coregonus sp. 'balchen']